LILKIESEYQYKRTSKMGIRGLSKYFKNNINRGVSKLDIAELSGKKIVIDTSIYMYRFNENNEMLENFYTMIMLFRFHNITPLFIFDGIAPKEKQQTIKDRQEERVDAQDKYETIGNTLSSYSLHELKRKRTRVSNKDRKQLRELFDHSGVMYTFAMAEADSLCAEYVLSGEAWACMSDDMDLFVYNCPRVIRYFSLINKTAILYTISEILAEIDISFDIFQDICILSGTDYNKTPYDIEYVMSLYKSNTHHMIDIDEVQHGILKHLFVTNPDDIIEPIISGARDEPKLREFLEENNFIFI